MEIVPNSKKNYTTFSNWIKLVLCGMLMGAADIVPGISGGTIAFILGFYPELLESIKSFDSKALHHLLRLNVKAFFKSISWQFLSALFLGIGLSFVLLAHIFDYLLNHELYRTYLYASFFGLIVASIYFCGKQLKKWNFTAFIFLVIGVISAYNLTGSNYLNKTKNNFSINLPKIQNLTSKDILNYDSKNLVLKDIPNSSLAAMVAKGIIGKNQIVYNQDLKRNGLVEEFIQSKPSYLLDWGIICCGSIAVTAMLLPGISGTYLLTILGMYGIVIGALNDFINSAWHLQFDRDAFLILFSMGIGILVGALAFCRAVSWLLKTFHDIALALLTGFMIGALHSVWPFWTYGYIFNPLKLEKGAQLIVLEPFLPKFEGSLVWISLGWV